MSSNAVPSLSYAARREFIERAVPLYREALLAQKGLLLDRVVAMTGYARKYAIRLLNQPADGKRIITRRRMPRYGSEVRQALFLAWKTARYICAKRLIPFLPTLIAALERHGYLHLTQENRSHLLQMSTTTAERLLHSHRPSAPRGLSMTQAGPLLKHQIPIRTFHGWDNALPGFLEADLVAHNGGNSEGCSLYTLTLTDVATGWTECLPVLYKTAEAVLAAFRQARALFPFPILGLDTDNGSEFINETLMRYCEAEQITFTRGRPELKDDQCFVEQKNGAIVRQFVGFDRFVGHQAARQLREMYRALRLYVNCFQPSMKLRSKSPEGTKMRHIYDPAKTPLQRLLLSGTLPTALNHHLCEVAQALDPLSLLHQVEHLQQALWRCAITPFPIASRTPSVDIVYFSIEHCLPEACPPREGGPASASVLQKQQDQLPHEIGLLDWPRTTKDPFEGEWELILSLVLAHPEWSGGELFQELQQLFPGRYQASQLSTLQHGLRKIRARWLEIVEEPWPQEVIQAGVLFSHQPPAHQQETEPPSSHLLSSPPPTPLSLQSEGSGMQELPVVTVEVSPLQVPAIPLANEDRFPLGKEGSQHTQELRSRGFTMTIEEAIQTYLQEQRNAGRSPKTLEWHTTSLGFLQQYLVSERQLCFLNQITQEVVRGWLAFLRTTSSLTGTTRKTSTIATYGRSARAFCHWGVRNGSLEQTPIVRGVLPKVAKKRLQIIEPDVFERLLLACRPERAIGSTGDRTAARNRAILWILMDTGMRVSELCGLQLSDVNREQRSLRVQGRGEERWLTLSPNGWFQVLSYLESHRLTEGCSQAKQVQEAPLFLSETYQPLTINALTLLFDRLRKRAKMTEEHINPSRLRDTFAVRYLQAGGEREVLRALLGLTGMESVKRYEHLRTQQIAYESQKEPAEQHRSKAMAVPQKRKRRRRQPSSSATRSHQQRGADRTYRAGKKKTAPDVEEDP